MLSVYLLADPPTILQATTLLYSLTVLIPSYHDALKKSTTAISLLININCEPESP